MELSLICPVKHVEWTRFLPGRFCIAPVALKHTNYRSYFVNAAIDDYKVILDNGVFEDTRVQAEDYINLARHIKPRVLVIPDVINAGAGANYDAALSFIDLLKVEELNNSLPEPVELMYVVQCEKNDTDGFWGAIHNTIRNDGIQWIGICRDAVYNAFSQFTHTEDQELNRFYFAAKLQQLYPVVDILKKKWHFLGIGKHLDLLQYYWFVDAMDTASLFYQSTLGKVITAEYILPSVLKRPKDYFVWDFGPEDSWVEELDYNCQVALEVAQRADVNRRRQQGGRL